MLPRDEDKPTVGTRPTFRQQMLAARQQAILDAVSRLLARKGFEAMTVDEVAAEVGIAKASLYKHFQSKEDLASAVALEALQRARQFVDTLDESASPLDKLRSVLHWALERVLDGSLPPLPGHPSSLRNVLQTRAEYQEAAAGIAALLVRWIADAQAEGRLSRGLPAEAVLYTVYARSHDPFVEFLRLEGGHSDAEIVAWVLSTCFEGLVAR